MRRTASSAPVSRLSVLVTMVEIISSNSFCMPITHNENFMAVFDDTSEVTITWNCNRYEIFEITLGGTYRRSFILHSVSYIGRCISAKLKVTFGIALLDFLLLYFDYRYVEEKTCSSIQREFLYF